MPIETKLPKIDILSYDDLPVEITCKGLMEDDFPPRYIFSMLDCKLKPVAMITIGDFVEYLYYKTDIKTLISFLTELIEERAKYYFAHKNGDRVFGNIPDDAIIEIVRIKERARKFCDTAIHSPKEVEKTFKKNGNKISG